MKNIRHIFFDLDNTLWDHRKNAYLTLKDIFDIAIRHRNRCAHNISSYQQNLPALEELQKEEYVLENYLVRFAIFLIIDKVFVALFRKYLEMKPEPFKL